MPKSSPGTGEPVDFGLEEFVTDEVTGLNAYTFADRVKEKLKTIGIGEQSQRPRLEEDHKGMFSGLKAGDYFNGKLPVVIRRLTLDQLSALYSLFTSWYSYLSFQTGLIAAERSEALTQKEFLWSHIRKQYKWNADRTKNTDQVASDQARGDYRFVKARARYAELNALYECMVAALEVAEQDMKTISREVTINQAKLAREYLGSGFKDQSLSMAKKPWSVKFGQGNDEGEVTGETDHKAESDPNTTVRPVIRIRRG